MWIVCTSSTGLWLISADGKEKRNLGDRYFSYSAWSHDGSSFYTVHATREARDLVSVDAKTGSMHTTPVCRLTWRCEQTAATAGE